MMSHPTDMRGGEPVRTHEDYAPLETIPTKEERDAAFGREIDRELDDALTEAYKIAEAGDKYQLATELKWQLAYHWLCVPKNEDRNE